MDFTQYADAQFQTPRFSGPPSTYSAPYAPTVGRMSDETNQMTLLPTPAPTPRFSAGRTPPMPSHPLMLPTPSGHALNAPGMPPVPSPVQARFATNTATILQHPYADANFVENAPLPSPVMPSGSASATLDNGQQINESFSPGSETKRFTAPGMPPVTTSAPRLPRSQASIDQVQQDRQQRAQNDRQAGDTAMGLVGQESPALTAAKQNLLDAQTGALQQNLQYTPQNFQHLQTLYNDTNKRLQDYQRRDQQQQKQDDANQTKADAAKAKQDQQGQARQDRIDNANKKDQAAKDQARLNGIREGAGRLMARHPGMTQQQAIDSARDLYDMATKAAGGGQGSPTPAPGGGNLQGGGTFGMGGTSRGAAAPTTQPAPKTQSAGAGDDAGGETQHVFGQASRNPTFKDIERYKGKLNGDGSMTTPNGQRFRWTNVNGVDGWLPLQ